MSYDLQLRTCAKTLRNTATPEEKKLWKYLRRKSIKGIKFRRQHIINGYIVDFYAPEIKLVVEIDGGNHKKNRIYDKLRGKALRAKGCEVLRFWNGEVQKKIRYVIGRIKTEAIKRAAKLRLTSGSGFKTGEEEVVELKLKLTPSPALPLKGERV